MSPPLTTSRPSLITIDAEPADEAANDDDATRNASLDT
jgi:hypothetical protein